MVPDISSERMPSFHLNKTLNKIVWPDHHSDACTNHHAVFQLGAKRHVADLLIDSMAT